MALPQNKAAYLDKPGEPLHVRDAPLPTAGPRELIIKNSAVAINPVDCHNQDAGIFVKTWPAIFGCDVAGVVYEVGPGEQRFKKGDRVIGVAVNLVSGRSQDGAFALFSNVPTTKAALLPDHISFTDGVVVPFALEAAVCALSLKRSYRAFPEDSPFPDVYTPALALPYPTLDRPMAASDQSLIVYGGSSSVGSMVTQLASAAGIHVISIVGAHNFDFSKRCGAAEVFDHKDPDVVAKVLHSLQAAPERKLVGIFDAIFTSEAVTRDLEILSKMGGGQLAGVHPPPPGIDVPENVKIGMIFAINDIVNPVWKDFVTPALESGQLKCLPPPMIVGKGLESINEALKMSKAGVSAKKLVVEL